jgi:ELWxxDGT repeat protein
MGFFSRKTRATNGRSPSRAFRPRLEVLEDRCLMTASMLADLASNTLDGVAVGSHNGSANLANANMVTIGNFAYFIGNGGQDSGYELWKTDGTEAGTVLVKDILPGDDGIRTTSTSQRPGQLTAVGETLYFVGAGVFGGQEALWKSDGTAAGTVSLTDPDFSAEIRNLTNVGGTLFFVSDTGSGGSLWKSNGTRGGTSLVANVSAFNLTSVNNTLFFVSGGELWKSNGNTPGTVLVKDINPTGTSNPRNLTSGNGILYFEADDGSSGNELWRSDGTTDGTFRLKDINPGPGSGIATSFPIDGDRFTTINGTRYFVANDGVNGNELWKSDGTPAGTVMLDIFPGSQSSNPSNLLNVNGTLWFRGDDGTNGAGEYKTDGTVAGTSFISSLRILASTDTLRPVWSVVVGSTVFFELGELWKSDGTAAGTGIVKDIFPGGTASLPRALTNLNGTLLFSANTPTAGRELWKSDGTEAGTVLVKDINVDTPSSNPQSFVESGGATFFTAGSKLWKTTGTLAGTTLVKDFKTPDVSTATLLNLAEVNGTLYAFTRVTIPTGQFTAPIVRHELWKSDGTGSGTTYVGDIGSVDFDSGVPYRNVNGTLYFSTANGGGGVKKTDGISITSLFNWTMLPTEVNGTLYFGRFLPGVGEIELWKTDGTEVGTVRVLDINPTGSANPLELTNVNGTLYFSADDGITGRELWRSDGTASGTFRVKDISPGGVFGPAGLTNINGTLYFSADDGVAGRELWKSDGTASGTVRVKDINSGSGSSHPRNITSVGSIVFFLAGDDRNNYQLWRTDGTGSGTFLVKSSNPVYVNTNARPTGVNGTLYFAARSESPVFTPLGLWESDGTDVGTKLVRDDIPEPMNLTSSTAKLYFSADDGIHGREPWVASVDVDSDGIADTLEAGAPNGGDGNGDGTPDSQQAEVASLPNAIDGNFVTLASPTGTVLTDVTAVQNPSPNDTPAGVVFPVGHLEFKVEQITAGGATTVTLYLRDDTVVNTYFKYGPTPDNATPHWYEFL